jgi:hypothetical protein
VIQQRRDLELDRLALRGLAQSPEPVAIGIDVR